jgi:ubiquinone/menaquinone biosynthesis C-methylase UbiE
MSSSSSIDLTTTTNTAWSRQASEYADMMRTGPMIPVIRNMLDALATIRPFATATTILDVGCGPGSATYTLLNERAREIAPDAKVVASDFSEGMVEQVRALREIEVAGLQDNEPGQRLWQNLEAYVWNAQDLSAQGDNTVSHLIASLVLFMVPDPVKALAESYRVLESGGAFSCSSWKRVSWMELVLESQGKDPAGFKLPERWSSVGQVKTLLKDAGFVDVKVQEVETSMDVSDARRMAKWFFGSANPPLVKMSEGCSEEERVNCRKSLTRLFEERRDPATKAIPGVGIVASARKA